MIGKLSSEIEREINRTGFHILRKSFVKNKMYPNPFPDYGEIKEIRIGGKYTIRLFVKRTQKGFERIDGGMIDVKILKKENDNYSGEILTLLPPDFPLKKGDSINLLEDEILFEHK